MGLIRGWKDAGFEDEWLLEGARDLAEGIVEEMEGLGAVHLSGSTGPWSRILVQQSRIPLHVKKFRPDVLLCTTPVVPVATLGIPTVAVVHDLRHLTRPEDFSTFQNLYRRRAWPSGLRRATRLIADSERTRRDLAEKYPFTASKTDVVYLGSDHVDGQKREPAGHGIAFARWANKRPDFAIRSWAALKQLRPDLNRALHIVGAAAEEHPALLDLASQLGIADLVVVHPFLGEEEYWRLFGSASVVLFASHFEGFGLPVLESMRLRIPVVTWRDPAVVEVAGECAFYAEPTPDDFAARTEQVLWPPNRSASLVEAAYDRSASWTWRATAEQTRAVLEQAVEQGS